MYASLTRDAVSRAVALGDVVGCVSVEIINSHPLELPVPVAYYTYGIPLRSATYLETAN